MLWASSRRQRQQRLHLLLSRLRLSLLLRLSRARHPPTGLDEVNKLFVL
jgi:hypothetical protein